MDFANTQPLWQPINRNKKLQHIKMEHKGPVWLIHTNHLINRVIYTLYIYWCFFFTVSCCVCVCNLHIRITPFVHPPVGKLPLNISAPKQAWLQFPKGSRPVNLRLLGQVGSLVDPMSFLTFNVNSNSKTSIKLFTTFIHIFRIVTYCMLI